MVDKAKEKRIMDQRTGELKSPLSSGRSDKYAENYKLWQALSFCHKEALGDGLDYFDGAKDKINTETILGKSAKKPLILERPLIIADMSFGALSETIKLAFAKGATEAGIAASTGEGGILPGEKESARKLIVQYSTGRFGWPERLEKYNYWLREVQQLDKRGWANIDKTDSIYKELTETCKEYAGGCAALCFKFGQGAKPGQGGLLCADKVTERIAEIRKIEKGKNCHSPAGHYDIKSFEDLKAKIDWLKIVSDGAPIIIKFGAGHIERDILLAIKTGADIIELDGAEGGTGASPDIVLNEVGIPTIAALARAIKFYEKLKARGRATPELVIGGGIKTGADIAKCLALGADAVMIGMGFMVAAGCVECGLCYAGKCPKGIATQDAELEKKLVLDEAAKKVANYAIGLIEDVKILTAVVGKNALHKLGKEDMVCEPSILGRVVSKITGIKMCNESEEIEIN